MNNQLTQYYPQETMMVTCSKIKQLRLTLFKTALEKALLTVQTQPSDTTDLKSRGTLDSYTPSISGEDNCVTNSLQNNKVTINDRSKLVRACCVCTCHALINESMISYRLNELPVPTHCTTARISTN